MPSGYMLKKSSPAMPGKCVRAACRIGLLFVMACAARAQPAAKAPRVDTSRAPARLSKAQATAQDAPACKPEDVATCRAQYARVRDTLRRGSMDAKLAEIGKMVAIYEHLREAYREGSERDCPQVVVGHCRDLLEPILVEISNVIYLESRPGHPETYRYAHDFFSWLVRTFPDRADHAMSLFRLAESTAVLANARTRPGEAVTIWQDAADLYAQAARADAKGLLVITRWDTSLNLRAAALRAEQICRKNAVAEDPRELRKPWYYRELIDSKP